MPTANQFSLDSPTKMLLCGDSGCVAGDTEVMVTRGGSKSKRKTIAQLYRTIHRPQPNAMECETYITCDLGGYAGLNKMLDVVYSGEKDVYQVTTSTGHKIKATKDHKFLTPEGYKPLSELDIGSNVFVYYGTREKHRRGGNRKDGRKMVYSIPYHPSAISNWVSGRDYKRNLRARLVVEAEMNGLELDHFIFILRRMPKKASQLDYLQEGQQVHHLDGDPTNDAIENLQLLSADEHLSEHRGDLNKAHKALTMAHITHIGPPILTDTYDICMESPYNNYIANGIVVHNSGKTGSLISLIKAGYKLRVLDCDNGLDYLIQRILIDCPDKADNFIYEPCNDKLKSIGGNIVCDGKPQGWEKMLRLLTKWKTTEDDGTETDLGQPAEWGTDSILVIDSLSFAAMNALRRVLSQVGRMGKKPQIQDWGDAMQDVEELLGLLYSDPFHTNVIVTAHIEMQDIEEGIRKGFPTALGTKLPPKIPRYFNTMIAMHTKPGGKRSIRTQSSASLDLKLAVPGVPNELPVETGLATIFEARRKLAKSTG